MNKIHEQVKIPILLKSIKSYDIVMNYTMKKMEYGVSFNGACSHCDWALQLKCSDMFYVLYNPVTSILINSISFDN